MEINSLFESKNLFKTLIFGGVIILIYIIFNYITSDNTPVQQYNNEATNIHIKNQSFGVKKRVVVIWNNIFNVEHLLELVIKFANFDFYLLVKVETNDVNEAKKDLFKFNCLTTNIKEHV